MIIMFLTGAAAGMALTLIVFGGIEHLRWRDRSWVDHEPIGELDAGDWLHDTPPKGSKFGDIRTIRRIEWKADR